MGKIDGVKKESGNLADDWDFLKPKMIKDPAQSKPSDWVDDAKMDDPEAEKPEGWDDESDGEWEAPMIDNPEYKGEFKPKKIDNPDYKGPWVHPEIANPEFEDDLNMYSYASHAYVGFDLWQVKAGTIFDNIIVTDDPAEAEALLAETYTKNIAGEKKMFEEAEAAKKVRRRSCQKEG